jgi:hypothetical protein
MRKRKMWGAGYEEEWKIRGEEDEEDEDIFLFYIFIY